jgi:hypothetical protein
MAYSEIKLSELLTYASVYSLDITDSDIQNLQTYYTNYKNIPGTVVYKNLPQILIKLVLNANTPTVKLCGTDPDFTMPYIEMGHNIKLLEFPQPADTPYIQIYGQFRARFNSVDFLEFMTVADLKEDILDTTYTVMDRYGSSTLIETQGEVKMLFWAADKLADYRSAMFTFTKADYENMPLYAQKIIYVLEKNNTRYAIYLDPRYSYGYSRSSDYTLKYYKVEFAREPNVYTMTDAGRYFSHTRRVFYADAHTLFPRESVVIDRLIHGQDFLSLDNQTIDIAIRRENRRLIEKKRQTDAAKTLSIRMAARINDMENGTPFTFNDVTFYKDKLEYQGQTLQSANIATKAIIAAFSGNFSDDNLNFDRILNLFIIMIGKHARDQGTIGNVTYNLEHKASKTGALFTYINTYRINSQEVPEVLTRALTFNAQSEYTNFLSNVSACSLRMNKYINSGLILKVDDEILNSQINLKVPIVRKKNINYLQIAGKEFKISDTNRLLNIERSTKMGQVINILLNKDIVGLSGDDIKMVIREGIGNYKTEQENEKKLTSETFTMFKVEQGEFYFQNGLTVQGFKIKGKLREYIIDQKTLYVYDNPTGRYMCMIDKVTRDHNHTARLINRIYALANDAMLTKEIHTLA